MRGRLWLLILGFFLTAAGFVSGQNPASSPPNGTATAADSSPSAAAHASEQNSPTIPRIHLAPDGDNQKLREQILNSLRAHRSLASSSFNVEVSDSQIELSGSVPTAHEKEIARRIAQSYGNNRSVAAAKVSVRNAGEARGTQVSER